LLVFPEAETYFGFVGRRPRGRNFTGNEMHFRSVSDLNQCVMSNLHRLPGDVDIVVGIPRSGLLPASLIALAYNLPLADVAGCARGDVLACGRTKRPIRAAVGGAGMRHALLVDDSIQSGASMEEARSALQSALPHLKITALAIYGVHGFSMGADIVFERVGQPRVFQWNVMHHKVLASACVDIDGILCTDPTDVENDDGAGYRRFLAGCAPLHRPTRRIHALITSRLEKYRALTEEWLAAQGIECDQLLMLDLPDAETRRARAAHAQFKAECYRAMKNATLFIESEESQAREIAAASRKPVLWLPGSTMIYHDGSPPPDPHWVGRQAGRSANRVKHLIKRAVGPAAYARARAWLRPRSDSGGRSLSRPIGTD
jgi:hypoxanthine phosphoribosyltransferase